MSLRGNDDIEEDLVVNVDVDDDDDDCCDGGGGVWGSIVMMLPSSSKEISEIIVWVYSSSVRWV